MAASTSRPETGRRKAGGSGPEHGREQKVGEALGLLEAGVGQLLDGEDFKRYLRTAARFHRYSANNCMLILVQRPGATHIAGYRGWQEMGRRVRKGEKGIKILAPVSRAFEDERTGEKVRALVGFKTTTVFDVSQTDGEPLPDPPAPEDLDGEDPAGVAVAEKIRAGLTRLCRAEGVAVVSEERERGYYGSYHRGEKRITLNSRFSAVDRATTLAHELAHHLLHGEEAGSSSGAAGEIEAEGASYAVCSYFGLDTSRFTFAYVARYAKEPEILKAALERIQKAAHRLIEAVEGEG